MLSELSFLLALEYVKFSAFFNTYLDLRILTHSQELNQMDVNRDGKNSLNKFDDSLKDSFPDTKMMKLMVDVRDGLRALEKRVGDLELTN